MKKFRKPDPRKARNRHSGPAPAGRPLTPKGRIVVGLHATRELLKVRPHAVTEMWLKDAYESSADLSQLANLARSARIKIVPQSVGNLDRVTSTHQGAIAFASEAPELDFSILKRKSHSILLALDEVEDPHNLGAVLRTAWLFGADGVLAPEARSVGLSPAVSKVAQGAAEHVPLMQDSGLLETLKYLKAEGYWLFGLSHKGTSSLYKSEIPEKVIWVLGSESSGIRKAIERECDQLVSIPQSDPDASFNVSVAAAIALSETFRQNLK